MISKLPDFLYKFFCPFPSFCFSNCSSRAVPNWWLHIRLRTLPLMSSYSGGSSEVPRRNSGADLGTTVVIKGILKTCQHFPTSWVWLLDCLQSPRWEAVCLAVWTQVFAYVVFLPSANPSCWHCPAQHTKWQAPFISSLVGPPGSGMPGSVSNPSGPTQGPSTSTHSPFSPKGQGCPAFWGDLLQQHQPARCRRGNAVPRAADVLLQQRDALEALGCSHGTTEAGFGFAGSTESCQGWKVRVAEGSQHGQTQTCVCTSHHKAAAR